MRIVIALGGNAVLRRSDPVIAEVQRRNVRIAARAIAPLTAEHGVVVVHGNGPQVGLLALQADAYHRFAAGSMGPKVEAATRFVHGTGGRAAIGALADVADIVDGRTGTNVVIRPQDGFVVLRARGGEAHAVA